MLKKINQTNFSTENGNCVQACIATIIGKPLKEVPNIWDFPDETWFENLTKWFESNGYITDWETGFNDRKGIGGFFIATVPSRYFENKTHAVVINQKGCVVHDPNSRKPWWNGKNVFQEIENFNNYFPFEESDKDE